jgi:hypothetical protein
MIMNHIKQKLKSFKLKYRAPPKSIFQKSVDNVLHFYKSCLLPSMVFGFVFVGVLEYNEESSKSDVLKMATIGAIGCGSIVIIAPFSPIGLLLFIE